MLIDIIEDVKIDRTVDGDKVYVVVSNGDDKVIRILCDHQTYYITSDNIDTIYKEITRYFNKSISAACAYVMVNMCNANVYCTGGELEFKTYICDFNSHSLKLTDLDTLKEYNVHQFAPICDIADNHKMLIKYEKTTLDKNFTIEEMFEYFKNGEDFNPIVMDVMITPYGKLKDVRVTESGNLILIAENYIYTDTVVIFDNYMLKGETEPYSMLIYELKDDINMEFNDTPESVYKLQEIIGERYESKFTSKYDDNLRC